MGQPGVAGGRVVAGLLAAMVAGCSSGTGGGPEGTVDGRVIVDGSSTVYRISQAAQLGYDKVDPETTVLVGKRGTGGGFGRYLRGEVDLIGASRPAKPEEESEAQAQGLDWTRFLVGYDGITVVVNPANDYVQALSVPQLKRIFEPDSPVQTWKDVDPSWPDRKIVLYSPDNDSGTFEFFAEAVVGQKAQRKDLQASADDNTLVNGVAGDPGGLGYFGYAYFEANKARLRAVPIKADDAAEAVAPDPATILAGDYKPLARPLYIYVKRSSMAKPAVAGFVRYYVENLVTLAAKAGYVPPTADDQAANLKALDQTAATAPSTATAPAE